MRWTVQNFGGTTPREMSPLLISLLRCLRNQHVFNLRKKYNLEISRRAVHKPLSCLWLCTWMGVQYSFVLSETINFFELNWIELNWIELNMLIPTLISGVDSATNITSKSVLVHTTTSGLFVVVASILCCSQLIPPMTSAAIKLDISLDLSWCWQQTAYFMCLPLYQVQTGYHLRLLEQQVLFGSLCRLADVITIKHNSYTMTTMYLIYDTYARHTSRYVPSLDHGTMWITIWIKWPPSRTKWASSGGSVRIVALDLRIVQSVHLLPFLSMPLSNSEGMLSKSISQILFDFWTII